MTATDMRPEAIERRLRRASEISVLRPPFPPQIDMGPEAVERRLRDVGQLHALERALRPTRVQSSIGNPGGSPVVLPPRGQAVADVEEDASEDDRGDRPDDLQSDVARRRRE